MVNRTITHDDGALARQQIVPVMNELKANATIVVATIDSRSSSPTTSTIPLAIMWKNGTTSIIMLPFAPAKEDPPRV